MRNAFVICRISEGQNNLLKLPQRNMKRKLRYFYYDKTYYDNADDDLSSSKFVDTGKTINVLTSIH